MGENSAVFSVGDVIRKLRKARGWSLEKFAGQVSVNPATGKPIDKGTISKIERGVTATDLQTIERLARALGKTSLEIQSLVTGAGSTSAAADTSLPASVIAWWTKQEPLTPRQREIIEKFLESDRLVNPTSDPSSRAESG